MDALRAMLQRSLAPSFIGGNFISGQSNIPIAQTPSFNNALPRPQLNQVNTSVNGLLMPPGMRDPISQHHMSNQVAT